MTCDALLLLLPEQADDPHVQDHLAGCADCRGLAAVLSAAAQPPLGITDKATLVGFSGRVQSQWLALQRRRSKTRRFAGLAFAASLGAAIASGVMWELRAPAVVAQSEEDSSLLVADDESSFEVSWPSLNEEGDVL